MKPLASFLILCCFITQISADMKSDILRVTQGEHVKLVFGRTNSSDKAWSYHFQTMMQYDTKTDQLKELVPNISTWHSSSSAVGRYNYISPDGNKVVFTIFVSGENGDPSEGYIVNWDDPSSIEKVHDNCYILCVGKDPETGKSWAYFSPEYGEGKKPYKRFNIDNPSEVEEVNIGDIGVGHFMGVSADCKIVMGAMQGGSLGKGACMYWPELDSGVNLGRGDGPVGTCNIGLSPDDEMSAFWVGDAKLYDPTLPDNLPHSALAVNKFNKTLGEYEQSNRTDFLLPNIPTLASADAVNTVICTQWAYDITHCRVGTYVAYHSCGDRCGNYESRGSVVRFSDDLSTIEDWAEWADQSESFSESRPHMWMYNDGSDIDKNGFLKTSSLSSKISINTYTQSVVIRKGGYYNIHISTLNGRVVKSIVIKSAGTYHIGTNRTGIFVISVFQSGNAVFSTKMVVNK